LVSFLFCFTLPLLSNAPIIRCSYSLHHDILALICLHLLIWLFCLLSGAGYQPIVVFCVWPFPVYGFCLEMRAFKRKWSFKRLELLKRLNGLQTKRNGYLKNASNRISWRKHSHFFQSNLNLCWDCHCVSLQFSFFKVKSISQCKCINSEFCNFRPSQFFSTLEICVKKVKPLYWTFSTFHISGTSWPNFGSLFTSTPYTLSGVWFSDCVANKRIDVNA